jgi:hypothetical protein
MSVCKGRLIDPFTVESDWFYHCIPEPSELSVSDSEPVSIPTFPISFPIANPPPALQSLFQIRRCPFQTLFQIHYTNFICALLITLAVLHCIPMPIASAPAFDVCSAIPCPQRTTASLARARRCPCCVYSREIRHSTAEPTGSRLTLWRSLKSVRQHTAHAVFA